MGGRDWFQASVSAVGILAVTGSDLGRDSHFALRTAVRPVLGKHSSLPCDDCIGIRICRVRACCATQSGYRITCS